MTDTFHLVSNSLSSKKMHPSFIIISATSIGLFLLTIGKAGADLLTPDSATTSGGEFSELFLIENLFNENVTSPNDLLSATVLNGGSGYATANPPEGGYPVTLTFEFDLETEISAFYLWNNSSNPTISSKGVSDFTLRFYDAFGGSTGEGAQIGADFSGTATQGPVTGNYLAEVFSLGESYSGVRSVEMIIANNFIGESWVGARELAFEGTSSVLSPSVLYPISATSTGGEFNANFSVENISNEELGSLNASLNAEVANAGNGYATEVDPSLPVTLTMEFASHHDINAFYLWNNASNETISSKGIKDFILRFYDDVSGGGNQIGSDFIGGAAQAPISGDYSAQAFVFPTAYLGVRSAELIISSNHFGSSWLGLRELAFDGVPSSPQSNPNVERVLVYLLGGQSNADGYGVTSELSTTEQIPTSEVPFFHGNGGGSSPLSSFEWIGLQPGSGSKPGNAGGFGPELTFGRNLLERVGSEKSHIAIIKHTVGGTNLSLSWKGGGDATLSNDGTIYQNFQTTVSAGLTNLSSLYPNATIQIEGMIWHQGEGDTNVNNYLNYEANLDNFINDVRLTYGNELKFVIVQLSNLQYSAEDTAQQSRVDFVKAAQQSVSDASPYNGITYTSDLAVLPDNIIHFGTAGNLATGERVAEVMMRLPITDTDDNGLDDDWEFLYFGSIGQSAMVDADLDGWSNLQEYEWQTIPTSSSSKPQVGISIEGDFLEWVPASGRRYLIETSVDLINWTRLESFISAEPGQVQKWTLPTGAREEDAFYRLGSQK